MGTSILMWLLAVGLVGLGFAGLILPGLPGAPLVFVGLVVAAWAEDFAYVGGGTIAMLGVLAILTSAVDYLAGALGARRFGAGRLAVIGAAVGAVVGLLVGGLPGVLLGPFAGAVLGELATRRDLTAAGRAGVGAWLGLLVGTAVKFALACSMIGVFTLARFVG